jgi:hypothetical protein
VFDQGEVFGWRMTIQGSRERLLDSVLPHEITHTIFASHFRQPLPRWADEGGATSVECTSERMKHRKMLRQFLRTGRGIAFSRMFAMAQYPRDVMPLYAQGYSLAEYLIQKGGRQKYVKFLEDGLQSDDWAGATQRHYGIGGLGSLQNTWLAWVRQGSPLLKTRPSEPAGTDSAIRLAANNRRPRPKPNLIYHIPNERRPAESAGGESPMRSASRSDGRLATASHGQRTDDEQTLPVSGWHSIGAPSDHSLAAASAPPPSPEPVRNQAARPQPFERSRQIILEWSSPGPGRMPSPPAEIPGR